MKKAMFVSSLLAAALVGGFQTPPTGPQSPQARAAVSPFEKAVIYLEWNATDEDMGVHIDTDNDIGLRTLRVTAPNGRVVVDQSWTTTPALGLTELLTESAEPDLTSALASYPAGSYKFYGVKIDGRVLSSIAKLSHFLLDAPEVTSPEDGADGVPTEGAVVAWEPVHGARGYALELEGPDGTILETFLDGDAESFEIPDGLLESDTDYTFGVSSRAANGNLSLTVIEFHTEG